MNPGIADNPIAPVWSMRLHPEVYGRWPSRIRHPANPKVKADHAPPAPLRAWGRADMLTIHDLPAWARPYYVSDTWRWCVAYGWPSHSLISCGPGTWGSRFPGPGLTPFPNDLRWRDAAVNAASFSFVVFTVIIGCRFLGRLTLTRMRLRRKQCTVCGYDIGAIRARRCPECGTRRST